MGLGSVPCHGEVWCSQHCQECFLLFLVGRGGMPVALLLLPQDICDDFVQWGTARGTLRGSEALVMSADLGRSYTTVAVLC